MLATQRKEYDAEARMTFTEHLGELRTRIIRSGIALVAAVIVCYALSSTLFEVVSRPLKPLERIAHPVVVDESGKTVAVENAADTSEGVQWTALNPIEPVLVKLKLGAYGGLIIALPYIIYQICAFVFPGLTPREKKVARFLIGGCGVLAIAGVAVAYWGVLPLILPYLLEWAPKGVVMQLRMNETVSFILMALLAFAIAFQFPMVVLILVYLGLLSPDTLKKHRRVAIVGMAIVSALLTPADIFSMIVMLVPLILLYELSIWASYLVLRRQKASAQ
jgi:sec-independent protein translocase protein TatC